MARRLFPLVDVLIGVPSTGPRLGAAALLTHGTVINLYADEACTTVLDATTPSVENPVAITSVTVDGVTIPRFYGPPLDETVVYARPAGTTGNGFPLIALTGLGEAAGITQADLDNALAAYPQINATTGKIAASVIPTTASAVADSIPVRKPTSAAVAVGDPVVAADAIPLGFGDNRYAAKGSTGGGGDVRVFELTAADLAALATAAKQSTDATTYIVVPELEDAALSTGRWVADLALRYRAGGGASGGIDLKIDAGDPGPVTGGSWEILGSFRGPTPSSTGPNNYATLTDQDYPTAIDLATQHGGANAVDVNTKSAWIVGSHKIVIGANLTGRRLRYAFRQRVLNATTPTILTGGYLVVSKIGA